MSGGRTRIRYCKHGKVRFTSHRDVARIWERALRRAGVPVLYSEGFSPRPKMSFGLALSTGYTSDAEYLDVELDAAWAAGIDHEALAGELTASLPAGMQALAVAGVEAGEPSLQHAVTSCTWLIDAAGADAQEASGALGRAMACPELLVQRERKGRKTTDDIRPAVLSAEVLSNVTDGVRLTADLATQPLAARPADLLDSLGFSARLLRACRLHQWIATDATGRREPLAVADPSVAAAGVEP